jgi:hypothetical protein
MNNYIIGFLDDEKFNKINIIELIIFQQKFINIYLKIFFKNLLLNPKYCFISLMWIKYYE